MFPLISPNLIWLGRSASEMYRIRYHRPEKSLPIDLPLSKSISNRLRVLQYLYPKAIQVEKWSEAEDSLILIKALQQQSDDYNFGLAGTSVRFFLAVAALEGRACTIDASERGRQRPIKPLVDALRQLGSEIIYLNKEGHLPVQLLGGTELRGGMVHLNASVSSQFITSLLLIAPRMEKGLKIQWEGESVSSSYWQMSCVLIRELGIKVQEEEQSIEIEYTPSLEPQLVTIESDWSSAAYPIQTLFASKQELILKNLNAKSVQPDAILLKILKPLGLRYKQMGTNLLLWLDEPKQKTMEFPNINASNFPDLSISIAVLLGSLGIQFQLSGLETLEGKESKRLSHLYSSLSQIADLSLDEDLATLKFGGVKKHEGILRLETAYDHRFVMAFTPLSSLFSVELNEVESVVKSFPNFWTEISKLGFYHEKLS